MSEHWIQTFTGKRFDLLEPTEDMIYIEDIAHHLSIENRFGGATKFPYSVGYHSILVSKHCQKGLELDGLLHDAAEAYCKDITSPMRRALYTNLGEVGSYSKYENMINHIQDIIQNKFKVLDFSLIKTVDLRMSKTEREILLSKPTVAWHNSIESAEPYLDVEILNLSAANIEELFLKEFEKLRRDK